jgi:kynurenine 3-monooxygenase
MARARASRPSGPTLAEDFEKNPVGSMVTVRCSPWTRGRVTLIGDAAHAIVPFYGQGANASFEDCEALVDALASSATVDDALKTYEAARVANANAIADMALRNFIEMRDLTGRASFKWKKKIEHALNRLMPKTFVPLYDLVSFSTVPYSEAKARGEANDRAIKWLVGAAGTLVTTAAAIATILILRRM